MIVASKPPYHEGSSLADSLQESYQDLVSYGSDGGMNLTYVALLQTWKDKATGSHHFWTVLEQFSLLLQNGVQLSAHWKDEGFSTLRITLGVKTLFEINIRPKQL